MIQELEPRRVEACFSSHCSVEGLDSFCFAAIGFETGVAATLAEIVYACVSLVHLP